MIVSVPARAPAAPHHVVQVVELAVARQVDDGLGLLGSHLGAQLRDLLFDRHGRVPRGENHDVPSAYERLRLHES